MTTSYPGSLPAAYAHEPDFSLKELIGKSVLLSDVFTPEKIGVCQKLIDESKNNFFINTEPEIKVIVTSVKNPAFAAHYQEWCRRIFPLVANIKGQADIFGFSLIARIAKYLLDYCDDKSSARRLSRRDLFVIAKLVEALNRCFEEKILDAGGKIEKELVSVIEQLNK